MEYVYNGKYEIEKVEGNTVLHQRSARRLTWDSLIDRCMSDRFSLSSTEILPLSLRRPWNFPFYHTSLT